MLQEMFRGRFTFEEAHSLINHNNGDCQAAVNVVFDGKYVFARILYYT